MSEPSITALANILYTLRVVPWWIFLGLSLACFAVLFAPAFGEVSLDDFRQQWGPFAWFGAIAFSLLFITQCIDAIARGYLKRRAAKSERHTLRFVPHDPKHLWWHLARQQDESLISQIILKIHIS